MTGCLEAGALSVFQRYHRLGGRGPLGPASGGGLRETYDPAKGEPGMALDDVPCHVPAVVALAHHALIAVHLLAERVLAAHEEEEHGGGRGRVSGRGSIYGPLRARKRTARVLSSVGALQCAHLLPSRQRPTRELRRSGRELGSWSCSCR